MSQISWRHHYIPQFYLNNFTNPENKFYIYLINEGRYKGNGQLFSPETHFFEKNGNTLFTGEEPTDFLETDFYKILDNDVSHLFNKIKNSKEDRYGLTEEDMPLLQFFVAHLFWRNPCNDILVKDLLKRKGLSGLGINIISKESKEVTPNSDVEKRLIQEESTYKLIKYLLPSLLFKNLFDNDSPLTILKFISGEKPSLINDNPLILRNPQNLDIYKDDFILPLSNDKVLIRTKKVKRSYQNTTRILIDQLLLKQAINFIGTTDLKYIPLLKIEYINSNTENLRDTIFRNLVDE